MNQAWIRYLPNFIVKKVDGHPTFQKILTNTVWLFADKIIRMGVGLFVVGWMARYLGIEQFGLLNYSIAFVMLFSIISSLGLDKIVVRDIVREPNTSDVTLGTAFALKFAGALLVLPITISVISVLHPRDNAIRYIIGIISLGTIFQTFNVLDFWFQARVQSKYTVYATNVAFGITSLLKIAAIYFKASLLVFAFMVLCEKILYAAGMLAVYRGSGRHFKTFSFSFVRARTMLSESWPLFLSGMAILVYVKIDQLMLGEIVGTRAVGLYSAAAQISEVWYFISAAIVSSAFPSIITAKKNDEELYYKRLRKLFNVLCLLSYLIAVPTMFLSKYVIVLIFGASFEAAAAILAIHIWSSLFVFLGVASGTWIITEGLMKFSMFSAIIGAVINILLNLILIPNYSGIGAAVATVISYACSGYISCFFYYKTREVGVMMTKSMLFPFYWLVGK